MVPLGQKVHIRCLMMIFSEPHAWQLTIVGVLRSKVAFAFNKHPCCTTPLLPTQVLSRAASVPEAACLHRPIFEDYSAIVMVTETAD